MSTNSAYTAPELALPRISRIAGQVALPGSKSIAPRALLLAALAGKCGHGVSTADRAARDRPGRVRHRRQRADARTPHSRSGGRSRAAGGERGLRRERLSAGAFTGQWNCRRHRRNVRPRLQPVYLGGADGGTLCHRRRSCDCAADRARLQTLHRLNDRHDGRLRRAGRSRRLSAVSHGARPALQVARRVSH